MTSLKHSKTPVYTSIIDSVKLMIRNEGFRSLWNGNGANVMRVIPNYGLRFGLNDISREFVAKLYGYDIHNTKHSLSRFQLLLAGAIAGVVQITLTYPIELMSTRLTLSGMLLVMGMI